MRRVLGVLAGLWGLGACAPDLTDLDCAPGDDASCPSGFWCQEHSSAFSTCADLGRVPLPDLTLEAIGTVSGPQGTTLTLSAQAFSTVIVRVRNRSTRDASTLNITLTGPACTGVNGAGVNITDSVAAGGTYEDGVPFIKPEVGCASPAVGTVYFTTEGKQFDSPFQIIITP